MSKTTPSSYTKEGFKKGLDLLISEVKKNKFKDMSFLMPTGITSRLILLSKYEDEDGLYRYINWLLNIPVLIFQSNYLMA